MVLIVDQLVCFYGYEMASVGSGDLLLLASQQMVAAVFNLKHYTCIVHLKSWDETYDLVTQIQQYGTMCSVY